MEAYLKAQLDYYFGWLDRFGLSKDALEDIRCEMLGHASYLDVEMESDQYLPVKPFLRKSGLTPKNWQARQPMFQRELRKGRRDLLRAVLEAAERFENFSYEAAAHCSCLSCVRSARVVALERYGG